MTRAVCVLLAALGLASAAPGWTPQELREKPSESLLGLSEGRLGVSAFLGADGGLEPVAAYQFAGPTMSEGLAWPQAWIFSPIERAEPGLAIGASYSLGRGLSATAGLGWQAEPFRGGVFLGLHLRI